MKSGMRFSGLFVAFASMLLLIGANDPRMRDPISYKAGADIDVSKIADPKAKAAVEEIIRKQAAIKEIIVDDITAVIYRQKTITSTYKGKCMKRAPELLFVSYKPTVGRDVGSFEGLLMDGEYCWEIHGASPVGLKALVEHQKTLNKTQAEIDAAIAKAKVTYTKYDLAQLKEAGNFDMFFYLRESFLRLLQPVDPARLKLAGETPTEWVLTSNVKNFAGDPDAAQDNGKYLRLTFKKDTGVCVKYEQYTNAGEGTTLTLDKIQVNPAKPIPDTTFKYEPAPGVEFEDGTEHRIRNDKNTETIVGEGWYGIW